jgi:hypothetical protein
MKAKAKTESNMASLAVIGVDIGKEPPRRHRAARLRCLARPQHPAKRPWNVRALIVTGIGWTSSIFETQSPELTQWWPISLAEIRHLQWEICATPTLVPGRITTIAGDARTRSPSPTQVAMPIIDRWLDQAPERVYLLADALIHRRVRAGRRQNAVLGWERALTDLKATAEEYNPDGVPVPIEGLRVLASYIEAGDTSDDAALGGGDHAPV